MTVAEFLVPKLHLGTHLSAQFHGPNLSVETMKKIPKSKDDLLPDYDFSGGGRGKYSTRYAKGSNLVVLDPDVAKVFSNSKSVNRSLRNLAQTLKTL